jgi:hypothetical protein
MNAFVDKYEDRIHGVISCFDRMLFRGCVRAPTIPRRPALRSAGASARLDAYGLPRRSGKATQQDVAAVLTENQQVCASIEARGSRAVASTPEQFADQGRGETAKWRGVVARLRLHYGASHS